MGAQKRVLMLLLIMALIVIVTEAITVGILYHAAVAEERLRLEEAAKSQARLIEAVARFGKKYRNYPHGPRQATLSQIKDAHAKYRGFGETGEFTLSTKENDHIVFLLSHRHYDLDEPKPVPWDSELAEPMRRALSGKSGTVVGLDYRGQTVLAAHEPVAELDLGIVAKIDLSEIRAPFIKAAFLSGLSAIAVIAMGAGLFLKVTNPILRRLYDTVTQLRKALSEVRTLRGIVPICSFCKKIRNDKGYWDQVEVYMRERTEAEFSHGICPDCFKKHYPDLERKT